MYLFLREILLQFIFKSPPKSTKIKENDFLISVYWRNFQSLNSIFKFERLKSESASVISSGPEKKSTATSFGDLML